MRERQRRASSLFGRCALLCLLRLTKCSGRRYLSENSSVGFAANRILLGALVFSCSGIPVGCDSRKPPSSPPRPANNSESKTETVVRFRTVDAGELQSILDQHKGQAVLVDFWATWCVPCVQGLPKTAELARRHADKGLTVITVSFDEKLDDETDETFRKRVSGPLATHAAQFTNLISRAGGGEEAMMAFDIDGGALPHYRVYGRDGKLLKKFASGDPDHVWEHADVKAAVVQALGN